MQILTLLFEGLSLTYYTVILGYFFSRHDFRSLGEILSGSMFGITLEFMNVLVFETYFYSDKFFLQLGNIPNNIPIVVGLNWGLIIFSSMRISDKLNLSQTVRPLIDAFLAITIDLSMDTIAIRIDGGFWTWITVPMVDIFSLNSFFGVNYGNFNGWIWVVIIYSTLLRIGRMKIITGLSNILRTLWYIILPIPAYILLYIYVEAVNLFYKLARPIFGWPTIKPYFLPQWWFAFYFVILIFVILLIILADYLRLRPKIQKDIDYVAIFVFFIFHSTFLLAYLIEGMFRTAPLILLIALSMILIDTFIHALVFDFSKLRLKNV